MGTTLTHESPTAQAAPNPTGIDFWVNDANGIPIKTRVFRAADGNTSRVLYALDGMRARSDLNGWEIETNVVPALTGANINVVMPVGGESSFYEDWATASTWWGLGSAFGSGSSSGSASGSSSGSSQKAPYRWHDFIANKLRFALRDQLGFNPNRNGVMGLSMGGSASLKFAAFHPDQFSYAATFSGYLNISAPGMREVLRLAMLDAGGYNIDSMAAPWSPLWLSMDPFVFAPRLRDNNTRVWISSGSALPGPYDRVGSLVDLYNMGNGMALEAIALANTRAFELRFQSLGGRNYHADYPAGGIHNWRNWEDQVYRMIPDLSANIG